jgi:MFS family permease
VGQTYGWRAPFGLYLVAFVPLLLGVFVVRPSARVAAPARAASQSEFSAFPPLLPLYAMMALTFMITFLLSFTLPRLLASDGFTSPSIISIVIGLGTAFFAAAAFSYGVIRARIGFAWTLALGLGCQGAGVLWVAIAHGPGSLAFGTALINIGAGLQTPNLSHLILDRAPLSIRGRAVGLLFSAQFMGPFLDSAFIVPAMNIFGMRGVTAIVGSLLMLGVVGIVLRAQSVKLLRPRSKPG